MKVKFGSIIVSGRGTLGGHVYSQNHYGAFARTKVTPINPSSTDQQNVRGWFQTIQTAWKFLGTSTQALWNAASVDYPRTDYSGTVYFLTGYNLFIALNIPHYRAYASLLTSPPTKVIPTESMDGTMAMDIFGGSFDFTYTSAPNNPDVNIYAFSTRPLSPGIGYISTELRLITVLPADGTNPISLYAAWIAKFISAPAPGQKIFLKLVPVNINTGDYGVPFFYNAIQP